VALAFLLLVLLIVIAAIALFVFPPSRWASSLMGNPNKDETKKKP